MSLRARLVATIAVVALVALALAGAVTYTAFSRTQLRQVDAALARAHEPIEQLVVGNDHDDDGDVELLIEQVAPGTFVAVMDPDGATRFTIPLRQPGHEPATIALDSFAHLQWPAAQPGGVSSDPDPAVFRTVESTADGDEYRLRISRLDNGVVLFIGQSLHETNEARRKLLVIEVVVAAGALVVAVGAGWWLVRAGLRPLRRVEQTALAIAGGGRLDQRAAGADANNEVGRLAAALNTMLDRIREAFAERDATESELRTSEERMRRFVADVSHELRTPLAAVTAYTELFERGARDHPDDLERAMHGIAHESTRMNDLVEELLLLASIDEGRPLERADVDLAALLVDAIGTARTVAPDYPCALGIANVVTVKGDSRRLRQVVDNLLANVRAHTPVGTHTSIDLRTTGDEVVITVHDDGPGMDSREAALILGRFYRTDSSRSRETGGAGLGLSIVSAIVAAHHGRVDIESSRGAGVTVKVSLPLDPATDDGIGAAV